MINYFILNNDNRRDKTNCLAYLLRILPLFLIFSLLIPNSLFSQINDYNLLFQKITAEEGLKDSRYNNYLYEDSKGFNWISSLTGLYRFDGKKIKEYKIETKIGGSNIQSNFFEDGLSNIWFSVYEGVICYKRNEDTFYSYQLKSSNSDLITTDYKVFFLEKRKNLLWLRAGKEIFKFNIKENNDYNFLTKTRGEIFITSQSENGDLTKLIIFPREDKSKFQLCTFSNSNLTSSKIISSNEKDHFIGASNISNSDWILAKKDELVIFNEANSEKYQRLPNPRKLKFNDFLKLNNNLFLLSTNDDLLLYDLSKQKYSEVGISKTNKKFSLLVDEVGKINLTKNQLLWVSHYNKGLNYGHFKPAYFKTLFANKELDITNAIIAKDKVLLGTGHEGVYTLSKTGDLLKKELGLKNTGFWSFGKNNNGDYFASTNRRIFQIDGFGKPIREIENKTDATYFRIISNIGNRTIVSTNKGLKEIYKNERNIYHLRDYKEFAEDKTFSFWQTHQSYSRKTYIPYNASMLWVYQETNDSLILIAKLDTKLEFFGFTNSNQKQGTIYAGTSKGLVKITQDTLITPIWDKDEKLKNISVYGIVEDKKGVLWLGTNEGLFQYFLEENKAYQYEEIDGIPSRNFSMLNSSIMDSDGKIWMGTNKGAFSFDPDSIKPYSTPPNIYIDELTINDKDPVKGIGEKDSLLLEYKQNTLLFDVKAIGYYKAERNKILYRMKGYEDKWVSVNNGQLIRYSQLPFGDFVLQVQAEDTNGNRSEVKELNIRVNPPFWRTTWFYSLIVFLASALAYSFYRYRISLIRKEESQKTAVANLNLQVIETEMKALKAQMNPHFLFNSMNSIKGLILKQESRKASEYLTKFSILLRGILTNSEKQQILLSKELETLKLYIDLEALRFTKEFDYKIETEEEIDPTFLRIPPLLLQPFVENAIWHGLLPKTEGLNKLIINIFRKEDFIICEIEDNGVGRNYVHKTNQKKGHKSMGIGITRKRIEMLHPENTCQIIDLVDEDMNALGTKVIIQIFAPE